MIDAIFGPDAAAFPLAVLIFDACTIGAIVNASSRSRVAFYQADSSKTAWIIVLAIGLLLSPVGFIFSCVYFFGVRRRMQMTERDGDDRPANPKV